MNSFTHTTNMRCTACTSHELTSRSPLTCPLTLPSLCRDPTRTVHARIRLHLRTSHVHSPQQFRREAPLGSSRRARDVPEMCSHALAVRVRNRGEEQVAAAVAARASRAHA